MAKNKTKELINSCSSRSKSLSSAIFPVLSFLMLCQTLAIECNIFFHPTIILFPFCYAGCFTINVKGFQITIHLQKIFFFWPQIKLEGFFFFLAFTNFFFSFHLMSTGLKVCIYRTILSDAMALKSQFWISATIFSGIFSYDSIAYNSRA